MFVSNRYFEQLKKLANIIDIPSLALSISYRNLFIEKRLDCIEFARAQYAETFSKRLCKATPKRQYEHILGRLAAAALLSEEGILHKNIWGQSNHGSPIWPNGLAGSISHSEEWVTVIVCNNKSNIESIGIDIELLYQSAKLTDSKDICFRHDEITLLEKIKYGLIIGFSIKEALYKCINPLCGVFFDFTEAMITHVNPTEQTINLILLRNLDSRFSAGTAFHGYYRIINNHIWTCVQLSREPENDLLIRQCLISNQTHQ